jgi:hypothetical protein
VQFGNVAFAASVDIPGRDLEGALRVQPLGVLYLFRRQLAFGMGGKPRQVRMTPGLSSSWYNYGCGGGGRPACGHMMDSWSTLKKARWQADAGVAEWYELAQDRAKWRAVIIWLGFP